MLDCWADPSIPGAYPRLSTHHPAVPTDLQAEVLIPGPIDLSEVISIVAPTAEQVQTLVGFLESVHLHPKRYEWRYSPMLFDVVRLPNAIRYGRDIPEIIWHVPEATA